MRLFNTFREAHFGTPHQAAHRVPLAEERLDQTGTDETGGSGDQYFSLSGFHGSFRVLTLFSVAHSSANTLL